MAEGSAWWGACIGGMCDRRRGMHDRGACVAGETATAKDGIHPTGMQSCILSIYAA